MNRFFTTALVLIFAASVFAGISSAADPVEDKAISMKPSPFRAPAKKRDYWPTKTWRVKAPAQLGMSAEALKKVEEYAFTRTGPESERKGIRTDGLVIIKDGYLVYEKYAGGFDKNKVHLTWSDGKSFVNALYGIAVKEGRLKVSDPAYKYWPSLKRGDHRKITIDHLLRMSSGLYANETYEASPLESTVTAMLFTTGRRDMAKYAADQDLEAAPGTFWEYSSPTPNLLMAMLKKTMTQREYDRYPWTRLFNKIGMKNVVWERDAAGTFVGSSYLYARPRDMAKFGYLFLNDGVWNGERILPKGWVSYSTTIAPAYYKTELTERQKTYGTYGAFWWLNQPIPEIGKGKTFPDAPDDTFAAQGHWGQFIYVIPSLDLVVAYTGDNREKVFSENTLLKLIIESIKPEARK